MRPRVKKISKNNVTIVITCTILPMLNDTNLKNQIVCACFKLSLTKEIYYYHFHFIR